MARARTGRPAPALAESLLRQSSAMTRTHALSVCSCASAVRSKRAQQRLLLLCILFSARQRSKRARDRLCVGTWSRNPSSGSPDTGEGPGLASPGSGARSPLRASSPNNRFLQGLFTNRQRSSTKSSVVTLEGGRGGAAEDETRDSVDRAAMTNPLVTLHSRSVSVPASPLHSRCRLRLGLAQEVVVVLVQAPRELLEAPVLLLGLLELLPQSSDRVGRLARALSKVIVLLM